jgi:uncharacterized protein YcfL
LVKREDGSPQIKYRMYVDDSQGLTVATKEAVELMISSSHEAAYILRGYPGPMDHPMLAPTIADNKQD